MNVESTVFFFLNIEILIYYWRIECFILTFQGKTSLPRVLPIYAMQ